MPKDARADFANGIPLADLQEGRPLFGRVGDAAVYLLKTRTSVKAFSAQCSHLGGPLGEGIVTDRGVICPWHHACFDLRSGRAVKAPAFNPLEPYDVKVRNGKVAVQKRKIEPRTAGPAPRLAGTDRRAFVIVGGGAAGFAAADALRRAGYGDRIVMFSADSAPPYDRTLLTKDYLDGHFGDARLEIAKGLFAKLEVDLELNADVEAIDPARKSLRLPGGRTHPYDKLLLATGSAPNRLDVPGAAGPNVHMLRTLSDCRHILAAAHGASRVVIVGGSFIGLEAAASLTSRGLSVTVVSPENHPMEQVLGRALSDLIIDTLKSKGVAFQLGCKPSAIGSRIVELDNQERVEADFVLVGIGVTPRTRLARSAGIKVNRGVVVDEYLCTSVPDIFAAGDIAIWPYQLSGHSIRVEHWVVAQRHGQVAAANMLGDKQPLRLVPFFWSKFFDLSIRYAGYARTWDTVAIEGDLENRDALLRFVGKGQDLAVATVGRDRDCLLAEQRFYARMDDDALRKQALGAHPA